MVVSFFFFSPHPTPRQRQLAGVEDERRRIAWVAMVVAGGWGGVSCVRPSGGPEEKTTMMTLPSLVRIQGKRDHSPTEYPILFARGSKEGFRLKLLGPGLARSAVFVVRCAWLWNSTADRMPAPLNSSLSSLSEDLPSSQKLTPPGQNEPNPPDASLAKERVMLALAHQYVCLLPLEGELVRTRSPDVPRALFASTYLWSLRHYTFKHFQRQAVILKLGKRSPLSSDPDYHTASGPA